MIVADYDRVTEARKSFELMEAATDEIRNRRIPHRAQPMSTPSLWTGHKGGAFGDIGNTKNCL